MGCVAEGDMPRGAFHVYLSNIDKVAVASVTTCTGCTDRRACIRVGQDDTPFGCHLPSERCIFRTTVNLERLIEFVIKHSQRHVARVVGPGLHSNQGTVEGLAVLSHVFIFKLLVPQADETLFQSINIVSNWVVVILAASHAQQEHHSHRCK